MIPQSDLFFPHRSVAALKGLRGQLMHRFEATLACMLAYLEHRVVL